MSSRGDLGPTVEDVRLVWVSVGSLSLVTLLSPLLPWTGLRTLVVLAFLLWAPGAAVVALVPALDGLTRVALAPGVGVAMLLLASTVMLATPYWEPRLLVFTVAGGLLGASALRLGLTQRGAA